jgi:signal transduction histidine kinase
MNVGPGRVHRRNILYWLALGSLVVICCVLALLQYRWIGEISRAEEERLKDGLQAALQRLSQDFNVTIESACAALQPSDREVHEMGREQAFAARFERWRNLTRHTELFRTIGVAVPDGDNLELRILDRGSGTFVAAEWPAGWAQMRRQLLARLQRTGPPPLPDYSTLFEVPRFGGSPRPGERRGEQDWLIVDLNVDYVRTTLLPRLLAMHLGPTVTSDYDVEVFTGVDPSNVIYSSHSDGRRIEGNADASVSLFGIRHGEILRRNFRGDRRGGRPGEPPPGFGSPAGPDMGKWKLAVQSRAGSLAALVERTRWRNLALSGVILVLLLVTVGLLLHFSRRAQQLADLQMNFVAGVSHELRTPLTVIRTAAFNLRGKLGSNPAQVEKYGALIQDEAEKLTNLVEQVLRFSGARAGHVISDKTPVQLESVIDRLLASRRAIFDAAGVIVETQIDPELPLVLGDEIALRHAVQNLLDNAMKYGMQQSKWIGFSASRAMENGTDSVEVRVSDRGAGIPAEEQAQIFDPFFRGRRAIEDQIHGTGLGLSLVKKIAEAHGGSVRVNSSPAKGTEFILRLPAAPPELQNEFAPSFS